MTDFKLRRMSQDEFLDWVQDQEREHEPVDGEPMMMTGARFYEVLDFTPQEQRGDDLKR